MVIGRISEEIIKVEKLKTEDNSHRRFKKQNRKLKFRADYMLRQTCFK